MAVCNASHNADSNMVMVEIMDKKGIPADHPHTLFSQLYGMSDNITFNTGKCRFSRRQVCSLRTGQGRYSVSHQKSSGKHLGNRLMPAGELKLIRDEVKRRGI
jgi:proline dehydrogenase